MKNILFIILIICTFFQTKAQENIEEEAIKKTILGEFEAFLNHDVNDWLDIHLNSPHSVYMITPGRSAGQLVFRQGFETMKAATEKNYKTPVKGLFDIINREDWNIKIAGNFAWASFKSTFKMGEILIPAAELKVFEKVDGKWKIAAEAAIGDYKNATPPVKSSY